MKNFFQGKFRKLSLTQQVMVLILMMIVFLVLFFLFFLSDSVSNAINRQMYDLLEARQEPIVQAVVNGKSTSNDQELFNFLSADPNIRTAIVTPNNSVIISKDDDPASQEFLSSLTPKIHELLRAHVPAAALETESDGNSPSVRANASVLVRQGIEKNHDRLYYYRLERVDTNGSPTIVVSFMNDTYAGEMRSSLMDSTIYITVLVFFLMLMVLLFWVFSIIHPLNQIKSYITQIKEGKDVDLYINRDDEIGDVAKELRALTEELAKQQKSKEEMIHNISHDLKTPIATIKSYSESIKDGIYPYGDLEGSVDVILDNANRLEQKVHSLLYMNRVEYLVSSDAEGVSTNMKEVIEEVVLNAKVIRPEIELITDLEEVYFDGLLEAWRVAIENILQNAFRYSKSYIKIELHENDLRISNDGPKMDESRIQSLFLPYIKGEGGRFGLGLSIVAKVVQANKYKVEGMNTEDGVCFRIYRDVPKRSSSRFKSTSNPVSYLNVQNWGNSRRQTSQFKKAAPDQKQKKSSSEGKDKDKKENVQTDASKNKESSGASRKGQSDSASRKANASSREKSRSRKNRQNRNHKSSASPEEMSGKDPAAQSKSRTQEDSTKSSSRSRKNKPAASQKHKHLLEEGLTVNEAARNESALEASSAPEMTESKAEKTDIAAASAVELTPRTDVKVQSQSENGSTMTAPAKQNNVSPEAPDSESSTLEATEETDASVAVSGIKPGTQPEGAPEAEVANRTDSSLKTAQPDLEDSAVEQPQLKSGK